MPNEMMQIMNVVVALGFGFLIANLMIFGCMLKLYTEIFKERAMSKRRENNDAQ